MSLPPTAKAPPRSGFFETVKTLVYAVAIAMGIRTFAFEPFNIPSASMVPTLLIGDYLFVSKFSYGYSFATLPSYLTGQFPGRILAGEPERGDVVVFDGTDSFVPAGEQVSVNPIAAAATWLGRSVGIVQPEGTDFIKRVIGVGGDTVACCDAEGRVTVNGVPLQEESYLYPGDAPSDQAFEVVVPEGMMWVMGDHRSNSADSRAHLGDPGGGMVPQGQVVGRAMNVLWPIPRIGSVPIPETFAGIPTSGSVG